MIETIEIFMPTTTERLFLLAFFLLVSYGWNMQIERCEGRM